MTLPSSAMTSRKNRDEPGDGTTAARGRLGRPRRLGRPKHPCWWSCSRGSPRSRCVRGRQRGWRRRAQGRQDSNLQQPVLETGTLPIELRPSGPAAPAHAGAGAHHPRSGESTRLFRPALKVAGATRPSRTTPCDDDRMGARVSDRIGAIAESATLAVDAKAKALKAAGRPVIGFGAGEPDFPTPGSDRRGGRRGLPRPAQPPLHARRPGCPSCARRSRRRRCATPASRCRPPGC